MTKRTPKILLTAMGSHGDLNPMIAIGQALQAKGASAVIGTSLSYQNKVLESGLEFAPIRPDMPDSAKMSQIAEELMDPVDGAQAIVCKLVMPELFNSYSDTMAAAQGCDAIVAGAICLAAPIAAAKLGIPWASAALQPMVHFSAIDPPSLPAAPWLDATRSWGAAGIKLRKTLFQIAKLKTRLWCMEHIILRSRLGLDPEPDPLFALARSPWLCLSMFPSLFAPQQSDWTDSNVFCGFPRSRSAPSEQMPPELLAFLDAGEAPLTFTLGTAAVFAAGNFYRQAKQCAQDMNMRAVFLTGPDGINAMGELPDSMIAVPYAPHDLLFPRSKSIIHSCGIGTSAAGLYSGVPALCVPWANDQPDNARRLANLQTARVLPRQDFNAVRAVESLCSLISDTACVNSSRRIAAFLSKTANGSEIAAQALLDRLGRAQAET